MRYDAAVIGSGVAGLTSAIILAKSGLKVIVLEQHAVPGGLMQVYRRGRHILPSGVHRLGGLGRDQILHKYLRYLGVMDRLHVVPMAAGGFEEYRFPGMSFRVPSGADAFRQRLLEHFPSESQATNRFLDDMAQTVRGFPLYNLDAQLEQSFVGTSEQSLQAYVESLTTSRELQAVLTAANPLYGVIPHDCPTYVHFLVVDSFLTSSWRVDEASTPLAGAFVASLHSHGGEIRTHASVEHIWCNGDHVGGVTLADGEGIEADIVIYTGHPGRLPAMCPPGAMRRVFQDRLLSLANTPSPFGLALEWNSASCPLADHDIYIYDSWDTGRQYRQQLMPPGNRPHMVYCSAQPRSEHGRCAVTALCLAPHHEWDAWKDTHGARGESYASAKQTMASKVLDVLVEQWPQVADARILDTYTPLTMRDYTLAPDGTAYGICKSLTAGKAAMLSPRTRVPGLLLAGQSMILPGILGSLISAVDACRAVPGQEYLVHNMIRELT